MTGRVDPVGGRGGGALRISGTNADALAVFEKVVAEATGRRPSLFVNFTPKSCIMSTFVTS